MASIKMVRKENHDWFLKEDVRPLVTCGCGSELKGLSNMQRPSNLKLLCNVGELQNKLAYHCPYVFLHTHIHGITELGGALVAKWVG